MSDPAEGTSIAELFARDPLKLSEQDLDKIIERMRAARTQFNLGDKTAGKVAAPKAKKPVKVSEVSLSDLGL